MLRVFNAFRHRSGMTGHVSGAREYGLTYQMEFRSTDNSHAGCQHDRHMIYGTATLQPEWRLASVECRFVASSADSGSNKAAAPLRKMQGADAVASSSHATALFGFRRPFW